jgi:hypothetical protein
MVFGNPRGRTSSTNVSSITDSAFSVTVMKVGAVRPEACPATTNSVRLRPICGQHGRGIRSSTVEEARFD